MAPAVATCTGAQRQNIDDPQLAALLERLCSYDKVSRSKNYDCENDETSQMVDVEGLVGELGRWPRWRFEELADLHEWIRPLNAMDKALSQLISTNPLMILIAPSKEFRRGNEKVNPRTQAENESEVNSVPPSVLHATATILRFLSNLLKNGTNKNVFNSVRELTDLLSAADDTVAALALEVLSSLSMPPVVHRQQSPDSQQHSTALHTSSSGVAHSRLMMLAKGWGSRGSGLGLAECVSADDSASGQGALSGYAGEVRFEFLPPSSTRALNIHLSTEEMTSTATTTDRQQEKRRKMTTCNIVGAPPLQLNKSSSHLFFQSLDQIGGRSQISSERSFALLTHIRLAASFHSQARRIAAVERRLHALLAVLHAHPSQEVLVGYFHAQQELCGELVDLIRPTVSPSAVSSSGWRKCGVRGGGDAEECRKKAAIAAIADASSSKVPFKIRSLAVEVLIALVSRNDGSSTNVSHVARQSNILVELGVGKGQVLGLLPTLVKYSLASLNGFLSTGNFGSAENHVDTMTGMDIDTVDEEPKPTSEDNNMKLSRLKQSDTDDDVGLDLGLTFLEAIKPPRLKRRELEEKALEFIDLVLGLVSAIISFPSGTTALTDCGLVPALVSTIALDSHFMQIGGTSPFAREESGISVEVSYADSLLKFIIAQAIQILEGALSTHVPALCAFYELKGTDLLVTRLHLEIKGIQENVGINPGDNIKLQAVNVKYLSDMRPLKAARRALLFSIITCLTAAFHRQETSSRVSSSNLSISMQLRKSEMTDSLIDIMNHVWSYGGMMAALACQLLSNVMNSDPQVVHYIHNSGIAGAFLRMIKGVTSRDLSWFEPQFPPSPDLIMALPNVISALALTEDGAQKIREANPMRELLGILCSPKFAMPQTRCLLNEMASIIGSGLDEIMRYVPSLKRMTMDAIVTSVSFLVQTGEELFRSEKERNDEKESTEIDCTRTLFIQYTHNIGQVLEQVLQNDDHCTPFVDAGGIEQVLRLYPLLMSNGKQLLSHISCQSSPSVASLTHTTTANVLMAAVKRLAAIDEPQKVIISVVRCLDSQLNVFKKRMDSLRIQSGSGAVFLHPTTSLERKLNVNLNSSGILEGIPNVALHQLKEDGSTDHTLHALALFLNSVLSVEWMTNILSSIIKIAVTSGWGKSERDWQKDISSVELESVIERLSFLHLCSLHEVCRIRTTSGYDDRDLERWKAAGDCDRHPLSYKLRIVCPEGAVVRDGIEIDSCTSVGGLDMGEVIDAYDRCINGSGIMRYQTDRGWISEQTRGHTREPIVEVLGFQGIATQFRKRNDRKGTEKVVKCIECGIPDLCSISASVLARLQNSQSSLYSSLGRVIMVGFRFLSTSPPLQQGTIRAHISPFVKKISRSLCLSFSVVPIHSTESYSLNEAGMSMYFGNMLHMLHSCLYEDKRDKQILNVLLMCNMLIHDGVDNALFATNYKIMKTDDKEGEKIAPTSGFLSAIRFVIKFGLTNMAEILRENTPEGRPEKVKRLSRYSQRLSKAVAASFPPAISLLRRLLSKSLGIDPQMRIFLGKMKSEELRSFLIDNTGSLSAKYDHHTLSYHNCLFTSVVKCSVGTVVLELWTNPDLVFAPSYVIHPVVSLLGDALNILEACSEGTTSNEGNIDSAFRSLSADNRGEYMGLGLRGLTRNLSAINSIFGSVRPAGIESGNEEDNLPSAPARARFEPSQDTVRLMMEMGFDREHSLHAVESTESNTLEIAMEYALAHPPLSSATIVRQSGSRESRQRHQSTVVNSDVPPSAETNRNNFVISSNPVETVEPMDTEASNDNSSQQNIDSNTIEARNSTGGDLSENEKKLFCKKQADIQAHGLVKDCLKSIQERLMNTAINVIEGSEDSTIDIEVLENDCDGSDEATVVTVVMCSFLLDLCGRFSAERSGIVADLLRRMKSHLRVDVKGSSSAVIDGRERKFSNLCHAAVLFLRALPRTRPLVLKINLVSCLVQCVRGVTSKIRHRHNLNLLPRWLTPTLLFLDVMTQPMAMSLDYEEKEIPSGAMDLAVNSSRRSEYSRVYAEHKRQRMTLTKTSKRIASVLSLKGELYDKKFGVKKKEVKGGGNNRKVEDMEPFHLRSQENTTNKNTAIDSKRMDENEAFKGFSNIPTFMPLITQDTAEFCLSICLQLLRCQLKYRDDSGKKKIFFLRPTVTHGVLLLLTRILRSHKCASQCLKMGGAELLLSIQAKSRFQGHVRLIFVALRRMLEDESTLQSTMETEIRSTVTKLLKKQTRGSDSQSLKIEARLFVQAVTPLICRDPLTFLKAAATSIKIESPTLDAANGRMQITPLSYEERTKNSKILGDYFRSNVVFSLKSYGNQTCAVAMTKHPQKNTITNPSLKRGRQQQKTKFIHNSKHLKTKSPHRHSAIRRIKTQKGRQEKSIILNGSPPNHVTTLLLNELLKAAHLERNRLPTDGKLPFLCIVEYLEIIADLVLVIPVCAAAIHRYHPSSGKDSTPNVEIDCLRHALSGCPNPPKNIVSYLLHNLIPQPRPFSLNEDEKSSFTSEASNENRGEKLVKKRDAYLKAKISQSTARLLVVLVARAGEGRRRVISDLALALNGQGIQISSKEIENDDDNHQMWALQLWGELCIGLAAPRSSGVNQDSNSSLSFEVVKVMMESGMAHALMHGISRIKLHHPLAASASAALLRPLEVFTRASVVDTLNEMTKKEDVKAKAFGVGDGIKCIKTIKKVERLSLSISQQSESAFADDAMLEDGFDADTAERNARIHARRIAQMVDEMVEVDEDDSSFENEVEEREEFSDDEDDEMQESTNYDDDNLMIESGSGHTDEMESSSEDSASSSTDSIEDRNESEASEDSTFEEGIGNNDIVEEDGVEFNVDSNDEDTYQWDEEGNDDFFEGHGVVEEEAVESGDLSNGGDIEEGWTRIEPTVGHMIFGRGGNGSTRPRTSGFMIEAAEAVIGNILRAGEIEMDTMDTIAEIEDTLGIRISNRHESEQHRIRLRAADLPDSNRIRPTNSNVGNVSTQNDDPIGVFPSVNQQNPPENGLSSMNLGSRTNDIYNMECLYGGPPYGNDRIYYDLNHAHSETDQDDANQTLSIPSAFDTELFPGGPAASTHTRTPQTLHPLLSGVNLPPFNALLSATIRLGNESGLVTLPSNTTDSCWNVNGRGTSMSWNVNSRGVSLTTFERPTTSGVGQDFSNLTDDGQPLGSTTAEFSLAFEQTLRQTLMYDPIAERISGESGNSDVENNSRTSTHTSTITRVAEEVTTSTNEPNSDVAIANSRTSCSVESNMISSMATEGIRTSLQRSEASNNDSIEDGDHVASSLAAGLSLSILSEEARVEATLPRQIRDRNINMTTSINADASNVNEEVGFDGIERTEGETGLTQLMQFENNEGVNTDQQATQNNRDMIECPPGMDLEVFSQLPIEMQQEVAEMHQTASRVADQLDSSSSLDPEALAALPEDMRREVIEQEQSERRLREQEQAPADPSNAEEMDTVSFLATLAPNTDIREQVLLDLENHPEIDFRSLPPDILAEIQLLRERASTRSRRNHDETAAMVGIEQQTRDNSSPNTEVSHSAGASNRKRNKVGKMRVDCDRSTVVYSNSILETRFGPLVTVSSMKALISLMYLLSPVRPQRLLQKLLQNLCGNLVVRRTLMSVFVFLLNDEPQNARDAIYLLSKEFIEAHGDKFPPKCLMGTAPDIIERESFYSGFIFHRRRSLTPAAAIAANFPISAISSCDDNSLPPVVARRIVGTLLFLSKNTIRVSLDLLRNFEDQVSITDKQNVRHELNLKCVDTLLGLLGKPLYAKSSSNLDDLLNMIENVCSPLSFISRDTDEKCVLAKDLDAATAAGKEFIKVPKVIISAQRLKLLCSILRLETCKDSSFAKINTIAKRLCRVDANRDCILRELAAVAQGLGAHAIRDLKSLSIRLNDAVKLHREQLLRTQNGYNNPFGSDSKSHYGQIASTPSNSLLSGTPSSAVTLSTSSSELKLLRVLQSLYTLCGETLDDCSNKRNDMENVVSQELVSLINSINLESLWEQLTSCLRVVSILEGVTNVDEINKKTGVHRNSFGDENRSYILNGRKKLQNSVAGLLSRFLPTIEAFFVVNASVTETPSKNDLQQLMPASLNTDEYNGGIEMLVGGARLIQFVGENKVLLNALLRSNPSLLDKGLRAMVKVPRCRPFLDFDVKRQWFKTQVRRLRQHANRRHGSLRLNIRRQNVFEEAFRQLSLRNADEMRGRLQITFTNEEGVDAGGLSREFFGILAKEMFNPNYALFTSTEDGCTFQPNPHSSINPDHLSYFRFVGRIVGKAVVDGFLLDAHFTRSLYKHMLSVKPTHHDMQAIDPDYYKNLKMILEYNLEDVGLDLSFSTEAHSFGRSNTVDLMRNGRNVKVTEENKEKYVSLVCQYRMTTAIEKQIKAYLDGFYELVKPDLISIFTAKELELLISGMPDIDINDLKKNTEYQGYKSSDKEIGWFWNIMFSLLRSEKAAFLQFVTGSSKVPLAGFAELQGMRGIQKFSIHKARGSNGALISAHTCFNALDLPIYKSETEMKEKLLYAIQEGGGGFLFA